MTRIRTEAACLDAAMKTPPFKAGYLESAIRSALLQLEYSPNLARVTLERALKELPMRKVAYILAALAMLTAFHIGMTKDAAALCSNDANMMECE